MNCKVSTHLIHAADSIHICAGVRGTRQRESVHSKTRQASIDKPSTSIDLYFLLHFINQSPTYVSISFSHYHLYLYLSLTPSAAFTTTQSVPPPPHGNSYTKYLKHIPGDFFFLYLASLVKTTCLSVSYGKDLACLTL